MRIRAVAVGLLILSAGCQRSDAPSSPLDRLYSLFSAPSKVADSGCPECTFGPRVYERSTTAPKDAVESFAADPRADYIIDLDDLGSQGGEGTVTLNGVAILAANAFRGSTPIHVRQAITLRASNQLIVRLTGKPGSKLRITVIGGAKLIGTSGGTVTMPGTGTSLEVPGGALAKPTEILLSPMDQSDVSAPSRNSFISYNATIVAGIRGEPDGLQFLKPATIRFRGLPPLGGDIPLLLTAGPSGVQILQGDLFYDPSTASAMASVHHFSPTLFSRVPNPNVDPQATCREGKIEVTSSAGDHSWGSGCEISTYGVRVKFLECPGEPVEQSQEVASSPACGPEARFGIVLKEPLVQIGIGQKATVFATLNSYSSNSDQTGTPVDLGLPLPVIWAWDKQSLDVKDQAGQAVVTGKIEGPTTLKACDATNRHCGVSTIEVVKVAVDKVDPPSITALQSGTKSGTITLTGRNLYEGVVTLGDPVTQTGKPEISLDGTALKVGFQVAANAKPSGTYPIPIILEAKYGLVETSIPLIVPPPRPIIESVDPATLVAPSSGTLIVRGKNLWNGLIQPRFPPGMFVSSGSQTASADGKSITMNYTLAASTPPGSYPLAVSNSGGMAETTLTVVAAQLPACNARVVSRYVQARAQGQAAAGFMWGSWSYGPQTSVYLWDDQYSSNPDLYAPKSASAHRQVDMVASWITTRTIADASVGDEIVRDAAGRLVGWSGRADGTASGTVILAPNVPPPPLPQPQLPAYSFSASSMGNNYVTFEILDAPCVFTAVGEAIWKGSPNADASVGWPIGVTNSEVTLYQDLGYTLESIFSRNAKTTTDAANGNNPLSVDVTLQPGLYRWNVALSWGPQIWAQRQTKAPFTSSIYYRYAFTLMPYLP